MAMISKIAFRTDNGIRMAGQITIEESGMMTPEIWEAIIPDIDSVGMINILSTDELPYLQLAILEEQRRRDEIQKIKKS